MTPQRRILVIAASVVLLHGAALWAFGIARALPSARACC